MLFNNITYIIVTKPGEEISLFLEGKYSPKLIELQQMFLIKRVQE